MDTLSPTNDVTSLAESPSALDLALRIGGRGDDGQALDQTIAELQRQRDEIDERIAEATARRDEQRRNHLELRESLSREDLFKVIEGLLAHVAPARPDSPVVAPLADGEPETPADEAGKVPDTDPNLRLFTTGYDLGFAQDPSIPDVNMGTKGWRKNGYAAAREDRRLERTSNPGRAYVLLLAGQRKHVPHELRHLIDASGTGPERSPPTPADKASGAPAASGVALSGEVRDGDRDDEGRDGAERDGDEAPLGAGPATATPVGPAAVHALPDHRATLVPADGDGSAPEAGDHGDEQAPDLGDDPDQYVRDESEIVEP